MRSSALLLALAASAASAAAPAPGHYAATLCVATSPTDALSCGPAELDVRSRTRADLKISDFIYRLNMSGSHIDVVTLQGRMHVDRFEAEYDWAGPALRFVDAEKNVRYEVRPGRRLPPAH
jgi:hypothetical protein